MSSVELREALESYTKLLAHPDSATPSELETLAKKTIELSKLAHSVMQAASPALRSTAGDLEHLLKSPLSTPNNTVSLLKASEDYLANPTNTELKELVQELGHNSLALGLMRKELTILSGEIRAL